MLMQQPFPALRRSISFFAVRGPAQLTRRSISKTELGFLETCGAGQREGEARVKHTLAVCLQRTMALVSRVHALMFISDSPPRPGNRELPHSHRDRLVCAVKLTWTPVRITLCLSVCLSVCLFL